MEVRENEGVWGDVHNDGKAKITVTDSFLLYVFEAFNS